MRRGISTIAPRFTPSNDRNQVTRQRNDDERNRAQLRAVRAELVRGLGPLGETAPAASAPADEWDGFVARARQVTKRREILGMLRLVCDVLRTMDEPEHQGPPPGARVRAPSGELVPVERPRARV